MKGVHRRKKDLYRHRISCCAALLFVLLTAGACGKGESREEGSIPGDSIQADSTGEEGGMEETESGTGMVAVAEYYYLPLSSMEKNFAMRDPYTIDGEWMYYAKEVDSTGEDWDAKYIHIDRSRISDGYREQDYFVATEATSEVKLHLLLADGAGGCYGFWGPGHYPKKEERIYYLEKYGGQGEVLWHTEYSPEDLLEKGESLDRGTVTADGRVFLYARGQKGTVFAFGKEGALEAAYSPELEFLEGVVSGADGKVYGYNLTGVSPLFVELGGSEKRHVCPMRPLSVYDGRGSGICLRDKEGMWSYDPEAGEAELLWSWGDEYIQMDGQDIGAVFRQDGDFTVMCFEQITNDWDVRPVQTFAFVSFRESREYPPREAVTLATLVESEIWKNNHLDYLVKWYNRQSRKYRVEIIEEKDQNSLEMRFVKGECPDLVDLTRFYARNLAGAGAFEDLTPYYEAGSGVGREDILDSVREACILGGRNVLVMPSFTIETMRSSGDAAVEDWDIWEFLEMGQTNQMFETQSPIDALMYCMGVRRGEGFVDYENGESYFDSPDFLRILEGCSRWQTYERKGGTGPSYSGSIQDGQLVLDDDGNITDVNEKEWIFDLVCVNNPWRAASNTDENYSARLVGYPGLEGAEYKMDPSSIFAMSSGSENKEGAWDFLEYMLSGEVQERIHWALPSRKDSFEKRLTDIYVSPMRTRVLPFIDESGNPVENGFLKELTKEDTDVVRRMVEKAVYDSWGGNHSPLWNIVAEEAGMYFSGDAGLEDTAMKIHNRVQLYLDEQ